MSASTSSCATVVNFLERELTRGLAPFWSCRHRCPATATNLNLLIMLSGYWSTLITPPSVLRCGSSLAKAGHDPAADLLLSGGAAAVREQDRLEPSQRVLQRVVDHDVVELGVPLHFRARVLDSSRDFL